DEHRITADGGGVVGLVGLEDLVQIVGGDCEREGSSAARAAGEGEGVLPSTRVVRADGAVAGGGRVVGHGRRGERIARGGGDDADGIGPGAGGGVAAAVGVVPAHDQVGAGGQAGRRVHAQIGHLEVGRVVLAVGDQHAGGLQAVVVGVSADSRG